MTRKVAYLNGQYPRATDTFIQREVVGLRRHGVDVCTFTVRQTSLGPGISDATRKEHANTVAILSRGKLGLLMDAFTEGLRSPLRMFRAKRLAWSTRQPGLKGLLYQIIYLVEAASLGRQLRLRGIEHLHNQFADASCTVAMLASELTAIPFSFTIHGPGIFFEPMRWRLDAKVKRAAFVSCISHFCRSQVMCFAAPEDWDKLKIIHCGVEPERFTPRSHTGEGSRLLFVGRLDAVKGLPVLLEALSALRKQRPDVALMVVGDGPDRARLEQRASEPDLAGYVDFSGFQTPDEVRGHLASTDVFVMTSFAEGVPVVLMEAMMAGVPVVAPRIAGIAELVEHGVNGEMTPPGDQASIVAAIDKLLSDGARRESYGRAGAAKVAAEFNIEIESGKLAALLTGRGQSMQTSPAQEAAAVIEISPAPQPEHA